MSLEKRVTRVIGMNAGAESDRARKARCRRGREPSEETAGQAAVIVDHDPSGEFVGDAGLIWNHFKFLAQRRPSRQSIVAGGFAEIGMPQQKSAG
jgi:hypothetical protein